ncbi:MAG: hypothetical protein R3F43_32590 [bacterium]
MTGDANRPPRQPDGQPYPVRRPRSALAGAAGAVAGLHAAGTRRLLYIASIPRPSPATPAGWWPAAGRCARPSCSTSSPHRARRDAAGPRAALTPRPALAPASPRPRPALAPAPRPGPHPRYDGAGPGHLEEPRWRSDASSR